MNTGILCSYQNFVSTVYLIVIPFLPLFFLPFRSCADVAIQNLKRLPIFRAVDPAIKSERYTNDKSGGGGGNNDDQQQRNLVSIYFPSALPPPLLTLTQIHLKLQSNNGMFPTLCASLGAR